MIHCELLRTVIVYDPCLASGEVMCVETETCSVLQSCNRNTVLLLAGLGGSTTSVDPPSSAPVYGTAADATYDSVSPVITLLPLGAQSFVSADGSMSGLITNFNVGDAFVDPGYIATDNADSAIQGKVVMRGQEIINMNAPTAPGAPYTISYNVIDFAGGVQPIFVKALA